MLVSRTRFLPLAATGLVLLALALAAPSSTDSTAKNETVAFFLVGDTHFLADKKNPDQLDERSAFMGKNLVDAMNALPGVVIPESAGGGKVLPPRGVLHAGDCIDTGDQSKGNAQKTEWTAFTSLFGLTGKDGRLKFPCYEVHGNHDGVGGTSLPIQAIVERNKTRPDIKGISKNGLHYSWDWGNIHFVNLGLIVGQVEDAQRKRRYNPLGSLEFLKSDLKENVGTSGRPVVIMHHVDMLRFSQPLPIDDQLALKMEWDPADVKGYHDALQGYHVAAIFYGHTHGRTIYRWDGTKSKTATEGIPVFNVTKSSHYASKNQGLFYLEIRDGFVTAREYVTNDGWTSGSWTPQKWTAPIAKVGK